MDYSQHRFYRRYGKRCFDIVFSGIAIILLSPILLFLTIMVRIKHGSPVLFTPTRPGKNERVFHIFKFRTMSNACDKNGVLLPDAERLTRFGKLMRATSLDELPELFNIFLGDMSFVGPRPLGKNTLPAYTDQHRQRFAVLPGLTGLAQIHGRNDLSWDVRFQLDLDYIRDLSFKNDMKILFETAVKVIKRADVTVPGTTELLSYNATRKLEIENKVHPVGDDGMRNEIGADFCLFPTPRFSKEDGDPDWLPEVQDSTFTFAGRSAIELALLDIQAQRKIRHAYVPSYCSFGMLQPFIERDIPYSFYEVVWENGKFAFKADPDKRCDVILVMNFFGCCAFQTDDLIRTFRQKGCAVIENITQTLPDDRKNREKADYYTASLRKRFAVPTGGWLGKTTGSLTVKPDEPGDSKTEFVVRGMKQKAVYMTGETDEKKQFLVDIAGFEEWLVLLDCRTGIDSLSEQLLRRIDISRVVEQQKKNARRLYDRLNGTDGIEFLNHPEDWDDSCPMYVPVLLPKEIRNDLETALADQGIYCPVTWAERMGASAGIRDRELSLVCDYRYSEKEMDKIADAVLRFMGNIPERDKENG